VLLYFLFDSPVKIHLPAYPPGVHRIEESLDPKDLDLQPEIFTSAIRAQLVLDRHDPYLQFEFGLGTTVRLVCDRCAAPYDSELEVKMPMLYVIGRAAADSPDDPEIVYLPAGTTDVDLTHDLRDFLLLAVPSRCLCSEDCKGLCPSCGADLNEQACTCPAPINR
jgi:uncharacterized protein